MDQSRIRNFCIIAHIDHGKSTLADRLLEVTKTISAREMEDQALDTMDLERERGITIKAQAVRMNYFALNGTEYELNLIDTPGHVDFTYEVSRSLAACEGAILVVDATQGIQAQTLSNVYLALENDLTLIPVINKIDLPNSDPDKVAREIEDVIGISRDEIILASAKDGTGTRDILEAIVERITPPSGDPTKPLRALIFDSKYDSYKGVIAYVRVVDGKVNPREKIELLSNGRVVEPIEIGVFRPGMQAIDGLSTGEVGYIATGLKQVRECRVGDTVSRPGTGVESLPGYQPAKPMVFAGLYPVESNEYPLLRDALDKLQLNDASLMFEPESSAALGFGYRCGFLGLLHMEIVQERLEREYNLDLLATAPSVEYVVTTMAGEVLRVDNPSDLPNPSTISEIAEPWMTINVITPGRYIGTIMELVTTRRGVFTKMEYLETGGRVESAAQVSAGDQRVLLAYEIPLSEILVDFYDQLKSRTQGYASLDYSFLEYRAGRLVKLEILVNSTPVDALSAIVDLGNSTEQGRALVEKLRSLIPRQMFDVPIQAAIGSRIVARETIKAMRKNVLDKCYGGDVSRKRKLLEKQAAGKKRMKRVGSVEIPQEAFLAVLQLGK